MLVLALGGTLADREEIGLARVLPDKAHKVSKNQQCGVIV